MELLFVNGSIIWVICYHTYAKFETGQQQQQKRTQNTARLYKESTIRFVLN